jgi:N-acetylmuramoyl-L-alanine amidase
VNCPACGFDNLPVYRLCGQCVVRCLEDQINDGVPAGYQLFTAVAMLRSRVRLADTRVTTSSCKMRVLKGVIALLATWATLAPALACVTSRAARNPEPADGTTESDGMIAPAAAPDVRVVYPPAGATLSATDSTFIFGSVQPASARVRVNGVAAHQAAGGGWLAYVPLPAEGPAFRIEAWSDGASSGSSSPGRMLDWLVRIPQFDPNWSAVLDSSTVSPRDSLELEPGDPLLVRFRGVAGLRARAVLGKGLAVSSFLEEPGGAENVGKRVFGPPESGRGRPEVTSEIPRGAFLPPRGTSIASSWYRARLTVPSPQSVAPGRGWQYGSSANLTIEIDGERRLRYSLRANLRLRNPHSVTVAVADDDLERNGRTDGRVVGRTAPDGVYFLFLPNGTRARTGRRVGELIELKLDDLLSVWAARSELRLLAPGTSPPRSMVPVVRTRRLRGWTRIVVPLQERLPVQVRQAVGPARYEVTIFGATADMEFMRYDFGDPLVREVRWNQPANDRFVLEVELNQAQPWGYRYGFEGKDFYLDVRHAPSLETGLFRSIFQDLKVVVDAGHSPDPGATGPTGFLEKDANLAVGLKLARMLEDEGATVVLTRSADAPPEGLGLNDRTNLAAAEEADLLISVHHNALPDGVNPFTNNGTSVYYYHPQSLALARAVQGALLDELELPDYGIGHGNLALVRPTEMPAVLTEAAFMMIPEQEERLRTEEFQEREARAILRGVERFLKESRAANAGR